MFCYHNIKEDFNKNLKGQKKKYPVQTYIFMMSLRVGYFELQPRISVSIHTILLQLLVLNHDTLFKHFLMVINLFRK